MKKTIAIHDEDALLKQLENISKKFASSEALSLTNEEEQFLQTLQLHSRLLSPAVMQFFLNSDAFKTFLNKPT